MIKSYQKIIVLLDIFKQDDAFSSLLLYNYIL